MANEYIIVEDNSYEDALFKGLNILNLTEDEVEVEVLEEKKGFLFKKGLFKLKITPIIIVNTEEQILDKSEDITKKVVQKIAPHQEELLIDSVLHIYINKTKLEANILLTEPVGGNMLSTSDIIKGLNEQGVVFGINNEKIEEVVKNNMFNQKVVVAEGKLPVDGNDGKVIYIFDEESKTSRTIIGEDGSIDYKNLNKIRNVKTGELLAEIIPPTEGINGTDIYGNKIAAKKGNPVVIKKGKNVTESEDGLKVYASKDGEVYFVNNTIYVNEVININGNIDNETGNIQFNGKVNIKGNIRTGFKVEAEGDIEVFGVVESATLISKGNIIIHRGIQGNNNAYLHCLGDFKSKYIENANIRSEGNVEADTILHSDIISKNKVIASGKKGLIVGGSIKARKEVRASILGSNMGTSTIIEVGIDPEKKDNYEKLKIRMTNIEKDIESSKKAINLLNRMSKQQETTKNKQELLVRLLKTYEVLKQKQDVLAKELEIVSEKLYEGNKGKVHCSVIIHPGVRVIIGNSAKQIYDVLHNSTLYVENGEVTIGPYER